jgi:hypothetical protein
MNKEFTFLGNSMENITIIYGIFLVVWGVVVTIFSYSQSITSLIPTNIWSYNNNLIIFSKKNS